MRFYRGLTLDELTALWRAEEEKRRASRPVVVFHDAPTMDQEDFRWGNDDGDEAGHTFAAALNTDLTSISLDGGDVTYILRIVVRETAGNANANWSEAIQSDLNASGTWEAVTAVENGDGVRCVAVNLTDLGESTQRVGGGTFLTPNDGQTTDGTAGGNACDFAGSDEMEAVIELTFTAASLSNLDAVRFRVANMDTTSGPDANGFPQIDFTKTGADHQGNGALDAQAAALAGGGVSGGAGNGALAGQAATLEGSGISAVAGNGAAAAQAASVAAEGVSASGGNGDLAAQPATVSGSGTSAAAGNGALIAQAAAVAGSGVGPPTVTSDEQVNFVYRRGRRLRASKRAA